MIDLRTLAGDRFRITLDPSAELDPSKESRPWLLRIPARHGHISVHSRTELAAWTDRPVLARRLMALPGVRTHQRGDKEVQIVFDPSILDTVAALLQARRKRQVTPEQRDRLVALGAGSRFARR